MYSITLFAAAAMRMHGAEAAAISSVATKLRRLALCAFISKEIKITVVKTQKIPRRDIPATLSCIEIAIIYDACYSPGFVNSKS